MTKKTKMILGVAVAVGVGYWLYSKYGKKGSSANFSGFSGDDNFFNAGGFAGNQKAYWNASGMASKQGRYTGIITCSETGTCSCSADTGVRACANCNNPCPKSTAHPYNGVLFQQG
jgi:hypothetical protein